MKLPLHWLQDPSRRLSAVFCRASRVVAEHFRRLADRFDPSEILSHRAFVAGYTVAADEIATGIACSVYAKERGLYPAESMLRMAWSRGYDAAICAHRLGHDAAELARMGHHVDSIGSTISVVEDLEHGKHLRPDPRQALDVSPPGWRLLATQSGDEPWVFAPTPEGAEVRIRFYGHRGAASARVGRYETSEYGVPYVITDRFGRVPASIVYAPTGEAAAGPPSDARPPAPPRRICAACKTEVRGLGCAKGCTAEAVASAVTHDRHNARDASLIEYGVMAGRGELRLPGEDPR